MCYKFENYIPKTYLYCLQYQINFKREIHKYLLSIIIKDVSGFIGLFFTLNYSLNSIL